MKISFELTGMTALLQHQTNVEAEDRLSSWRKDPENKDLSIPGDDRSPPWTWQTYLYHDGEHVTVPADNLMACLRVASAKKVLNRRMRVLLMNQHGDMAGKIEAQREFARLALIRPETLPRINLEE